MAKRKQLRLSKNNLFRKFYSPIEKGCTDDEPIPSNNICIHHIMECTGMEKHKTNRSQCCLYNDLIKGKLKAVLQ